MPNYKNKAIKTMNNTGMFAVAVSTIIERGNKILITKRSPFRDHAPNEWEAGVTGRVNQKETFEEAALREVKEETRLTIKLIAPFNTFHFYRGKNKQEHLGISYWSKYIKGEIILDRREQIEYKWVTPNQAFSYITNPNVIKEVQSFIDFKKRYH